MSEKKESRGLSPIPRQRYAYAFFLCVGILIGGLVVTIQYEWPIGTDPQEKEYSPTVETIFYNLTYVVEGDANITPFPHVLIEKLDEGIWFAEIEYHWGCILSLAVEAMEVRSKDSHFGIYVLGSYPELPCVIQEDKPLFIWFFIFEINPENNSFSKNQLP